MKGIFNVGMILAMIILGGCAQHTETVEKDQVVETIMARRSIRKYKPQTVEKQKMDGLIKCGINAPNGMHRESWEVRVVNTPEVMEEINRGYNEFLKAEGKNQEVHPAYGAPVLLFIAYDKTYDLSQVDCGLFGANVILSAQSMGLGSCCLGGLARYMKTFEAAELLKRLELPDTHELLYAIAVGYPDEQLVAKPRDEGKVRYVK